MHMSKPYFSVDVKTHDLVFNFEAKTSRGSMQTHRVYYISIKDETGTTGTGEIAPLRGLSPDFDQVNELKIKTLAKNLCQTKPGLTILELLLVAEKYSNGLPSVRFGFETALLDWHHGGKKCMVVNNFFEKEDSIPINGLIWMNEPKKMMEEGKLKVEQGFKCLKMKIGALSWKKEIEVLQELRALAPASQLTLRVDANGSFTEENIWEVLDQLEPLDIHSIEQPIAPNQHTLMDELCSFSPVPIAFDEELIGEKPFIQLTDRYIPHYLVLKPTLLGGMAVTKEWIELAKQANIGWWITSALESNIGLNAICQFTFDNKIPDFEQGLGTGKLYKNNVASPLVVESGFIHYSHQKKWDNLPDSY